jgi:Y-box-binding protein 1
VEFDGIADKGTGSATVTGTDGVLIQGSKYVTNHNNYRHILHGRGPPRNYQKNYQNSK